MNNFTENKTIKSLMLASILALGVNTAYANDLAPVPNIAESNPQGTLDKLAGQPIPNTDPVQYYPSDGSAYTLTKVQEGGNKPAGDNIVTQFDYDKQNYNVTPVYYRLDLKQTTYGEGNSVKYYGWTNDGYGNKKFGEVEQTNADITVNYNSTTSSRYENTTDNSSLTIDSDFVGIQINNGANVYGGAIYNHGKDAKLGTINGDFINNGLTTDAVEGGAIYNSSNATIDTINGNFVGNFVHSTTINRAYGGALENESDAKIGTINGNFIGNYAQKDTYKAGMVDTMGGAIINWGDIDIINGDFIGNYAIVNSSEGGSSYGGALENWGDIDIINGAFIGNYIKSGNSTIGGAIDNTLTINTIKADFINNYAHSKNNYTYGGAIANSGTNAKINEIIGDFINNSAYSEYGDVFGGAIYNSKGTIENINGQFIGNHSNSNTGNIFGGAIYNSGTINKITGDFVGNYAVKTVSTSTENIESSPTTRLISNPQIMGGAIYNTTATETVNISNITGNFIGNYVKEEIQNSETESITTYQEDIPTTLLGGAIANIDGTISNITGNFYNNYATGSGESMGGAIANTGEITNTKGDFIQNYVEGFESAAGGAIANMTGKFGEITGDFIGNYATGIMAIGGAIANIADYETSEIGNITGNFIGNNTNGIISMGGAIANMGTDKTYQIGNITGDFINNNTNGTISVGGAIANMGQSGNINGNFQNNHADGIIDEQNTDPEIGPSTIAYGGAIANIYGKTGNITGDFVGNYVYTKKAQNLYDNNSVQTYQIDEVAEPKTGAFGGAIANIDGEIGEIRGSFINNYAASEEGDAKGGAIYSNTDLSIVADNGNQIAFSGNYTESNGVKDDNAIYIDNAESTLAFKLSQGGSVYMQDNIDGAVTKNEDDGTIHNYNVDIKGDNKDNTTFYMLNDIRNADLTVDNTTLNTVNNQTHVYDFNSFTLNSDTNMVADVDLDKQTMDRFTADSYGEHNGNLHVVGMNMLSDAPDNREVTEIYFAQQGLKDNVVNGVEETPTSYQTTAYTPIYKYNVMYDNREDAGYFLFTKGDKILTPGGGTTDTGNSSDAFNPAVLSTPVASQAGAYVAQHATFNYAFQHADTFMPLPSTERFALRNANKYAITGYSNLKFADNDFHNKAIWVRPYTSFESISLKNGPKVDTITYGTLIGGDSDFKELRNGWGTIFTGYVGYNGSSQSYSGVNTYQNGGLIGATQTFYKGNFFTAFTASAGAIAGESHNMYGHENFTTLMAGVANKSGYNIEFKDGKVILQPTLMLSYSFIDTFDYRNSAGVKINSDPLHAIQINPNIRVIGNLKNGWQPYASVGMIWNILDETNVTANNVRLPDMSVKPFVEYGVGIQKRWNDKYTGYVQAMVRNGGRNGVALTGGFRWAIGKEGKPIEKVSNPQNKTAQEYNNNKNLKQYSNKTMFGAKTNKTTRTSNIGELK